MINLDNSWLKYLKWEFEKPYMKNIRSFLEAEIKSWKTIYPNPKDIFNALNTTKFDEVKVVIIWQDPYHWPNQAHWLSFSVKEPVKSPPSLKNIFKEINRDIWTEIPDSGELTRWAKQWVLLLNAILTVEWWKPASHSKIWWQSFTDEIIKVISKEKKWVIFLLWWAFAIWKKSLIDTSKHYILETTHPSPFSAHKWFIWSWHFSEVNRLLIKDWKKEITW